MRIALSFFSCAITMVAMTALAASTEGTQRVNVDNFKRAESDTHFAKFVADAGGLTTFRSAREPTPVDKQDVIRMNRDTLYSSALVDLDGAPVTVTLRMPAGVSCPCSDQRRSLHARRGVRTRQTPSPGRVR